MASQYRFHDPPPAYSETVWVTCASGNLPPSYSAAAAAPTLAICQCCAQAFDISGKEHFRTVKCSFCNEITPLQPPPTGQRHIRCSNCRCLIVCNATARVVRCPRERCKTILTLPVREPQLSARRRNEETHRDAGELFCQSQVRCVHCEQVVSVDNIYAIMRCSQCDCRSVVGSAALRRRATVFLVFGLLFLMGALVVALVTYLEMQGGGHGIQLMWAGVFSFVASIVFFVRYLMLACCLKASEIVATSPGI